MFGLHSDTTPKDRLDPIPTCLNKATCVVAEVDDCIARVLSHHVTGTHVRAEIIDDGTRRSVLIVQTATLVLIRKASEAIAEVRHPQGTLRMPIMVILDDLRTVLANKK